MDQQAVDATIRLAGRGQWMADSWAVLAVVAALGPALVGIISSRRAPLAASRPIPSTVPRSVPRSSNRGVEPKATGLQNRGFRFESWVARCNWKRISALQAGFWPRVALTVYR